MKHHISLMTLCLGLVAAPVFADDAACPWAGGAYKFKEHGFSGDFTVNSDCTEMVWDRLKDDPQTTTLDRTKDGWKGQIKEIKVELLENGHNLRVTSDGGAMRQTKATPAN